MGRLAPLVAFLSLAVLALAFAVIRVVDAYDWVAHTSDVRVRISRAIDATQELGASPDACDRAERRIDDLGALTGDNPRQRARVERMRDLRRRACSDGGTAGALVTELEAADATEIDLLYARRARLATTAMWALVLFVFALGGATASAIASERARLAALRKLEAQAVTDELTGLHNRRGFLMLAGHEHSVAQRRRASLLLVFVDLDGLKKINDELGHERGDGAIRDFAGVLRGVMRASDVVARLGGDEFAALACDAGEDGAAALEDRIERAIEAFNAKAERPYALGASVGCSVLRPGGELSLEQLVAEADRSMYERKRSKRRA